MINNLSAELNVLRPSMLETGLESVGYNLNRKVGSLRFFEFGKTYHTTQVGKYVETNHLALYLTGPLEEDSWKGKGRKVDLYYVKGLCERIFRQLGLPAPAWQSLDHPKLEYGLTYARSGQTMIETGAVKPDLLRRFDCKQELFFVDLYWDNLLDNAAEKKVEFKELPRQLAVYRDLAMVVDKALPYEKVEKAIREARLDKLQEVKLFDIFESEKLGRDKKSLALSFTFLDEEKTLTDKEIDVMVGRIIGVLEKEVRAEIRK
jgi:phenylalanyl-tRNA synthetase beta chain